MNKDTTYQTRKADRDERLEALLSHLEQLLPDADRRGDFRAISLTPQPACLRLNPLAPQTLPLRRTLEKQGAQTPWCPDSFTLPSAASERQLGRALEYAMGAFYIQAKAPTLAVEVLAPRPGERVLDLCASPGGKATQIAARMENSGLLVVNEPHSKRIPSLVGHLERCGISNTVVCKTMGPMLARYFHNYFDRILVDAPCSGDGILRKDQSLLRYWSVEDARNQAQIQIGLLRAAYHMLKPGGTLVYSTCSLSIEENEEVLLGLLHKCADRVEILPIDLFDAPPLPPEIAASFPAEFARCARVWPHLHDTEGAFVARIGKKGETQWPKKEFDAVDWTPQMQPSSETTAVREQVERQWQFAMPVPQGQTPRIDHRHFWLQPALAPAFKEHLPFYIRAGMRIARRHKSHYYLSQQATGMWGERMQAPRVELHWDQVRALFRGETLQLSQKTPLKGEVLCRFGPWSLCRGILQADGCTLQGMVPQEYRRTDLYQMSDI